MKNPLVKDRPPEVESMDPQQAALDQQDADLRRLEEDQSRLRQAWAQAEARRKTQQQYVDRLRSDGQALLAVDEQQFSQHERTLRELLRSEARAKNELDAFVQGHPDLQQQRESLSAQRETFARDRDVRQFRDQYFSQVQPAIDAAYGALIGHQQRKMALARQHPGLHIEACGFQVDPAPFARDLDVQDITNYLRFERVFHGREQIEPGENGRVVRMLEEAKSSGSYKVTRPRWTW